MKSFYLRYVSIVLSCFILLLTLFSVLVLTDKLHDQNENYTYLMGVIVLFISGFILSNHANKHGFMIGAFQAICYIIFILLANILAFDNPISMSLIVKLLIYFTSGTLGGVFGVNIKKFI